MAGETATPIQYQSPLPGILDLVKYGVGSKTTETARTTGDTDALSRLLSTLNPENLQALVANLFAQGAAQVPGLTSQYANATGTRVTNNSMLGSSLAQLNQTLAQSIAQAAVQQQQVAGQVAGKISDTNKTTTAEKTTSPGKPGAVLLPTLAGFGLNRLGKSMDAKVAQEAAAAAPFEGSINVDNSAQLGIPPISPSTGDLGAFNEGTPGAGLSFSMGGFDSGIAEGVNASSIVGGADASDLFAESVEDLGAASDVSDYLDFSGGAENLFSSFFKDGGRVKPTSYADGGQVRNKVNMGPRPATQSTGALQISQQQPTTARKKGNIAGQDVEGNAGDTSGTGVGVAGNQGTIAAIANMSPFAIANIAMNPMNAFTQFALFALNQALFAPESVATPVEVTTPAMMPPDIGIDDQGNPIAPMPPAVPSTFHEFVDPFTIEVGVEDADSGVGVAPDADTGPAGAGTPGTGVGEGGPASGTGSGADASADAGSSGGDAGGDAYQDGGRVANKSSTLRNIRGEKPVQKGEARKPASKNNENRFIRGEDDSTGVVNVNAHADEYILPADTVLAMGGPKALDILVAATHAPASRGTNG